MQVYGPYRLNSPQPVSGNNRVSQPRTPEAPASPSGGNSIDQLDISPAAMAASRTSETGPATVGGDMRLDKIADIRRQIANGSYDTPEKFDIAFSRLLDDLA